MNDADYAAGANYCRSRELAESAGVCAARAEELGARFQELENFFVLFRSEIGAHAHVHRRYVPLGGT